MNLPTHEEIREKRYAGTADVLEILLFDLAVENQQLAEQLRALLECRPMTDYVPQERGPYLLGRLERAAQADKPFEHGYADFRMDLLSYIRELEVNDSRVSSVRDLIIANAPQSPAAQPLTELELDGLVANAGGYKPMPPPYIGHLIARAVERAVWAKNGIAPSAQGEPT